MLNNPVPLEIKKAAFEFLFPDIRLDNGPPTQKEYAIFKYFSKMVDKQFKNCDVGVLYRLTGDFKTFLEKFDLDSGKREVWIFPSGEVRLFKNFSVVEFETLHFKGFKWYKKL